MVLALAVVMCTCCNLLLLLIGIFPLCPSLLLLLLGVSCQLQICGHELVAIGLAAGIDVMVCGQPHALAIENLCVQVPAAKREANLFMGPALNLPVEGEDETAAMEFESIILSIRSCVRSKSFFCRRSRKRGSSGHVDVFWVEITGSFYG